MTTHKSAKENNHNDWKIFVKIATVKAKVLDKDCIVNSIENSRLPAFKGDLLCIGVHNEQWVIDSTTFFNKYRKIEDCKDEYSIYEPIPEKSRIYAKTIVGDNVSVVTLRGAILSAKPNDIHAKMYDANLLPEDIHNDWVIDREIFKASYKMYEQ